MNDRGDLSYQMLNEVVKREDVLSSKDEADLSIIKDIHKYLSERIKELKTLDAIDFNESELSVKKQMIVNRDVSIILEGELVKIEEIITKGNGVWK